MQQIFIELSKYIFAFLIAFYTLASYQGKGEKYILRRMY